MHLLFPYKAHCISLYNPTEDSLCEVQLEKKSYQMTMQVFSFPDLTLNKVCFLSFHGRPYHHLANSYIPFNVSQNKKASRLLHLFSLEESL